MKKNKSGFSIVEILVSLVLIGLLGTVGWLVYDRQKGGEKTDSSQQPATNTTKTEDKDSTKNNTPAPKLSLTPYLGEKIELPVPAGWEKLSGDEGKIQKTIGDTKYIVSLQITEQDYLKLPAYDTGSDQVLGSATTSKGTKLFVIKIGNMTGIALSSCEPTGTTACSPTQNSKPLLITVATPGSQAPGVIDFNSSSLNTLISEIKEIASALPL